MLVNDNEPNLVNFFVKMAYGMQFKNITVFNQNRRPNTMTAFVIRFKESVPVPVNA